MSITHTARLVFGITVKFEMAGDCMNVEWDQPPRRLTPRIRRRYEAERAVFLEMLATARGYGVAVVDTDDLTKVQIFGPATKH